MFEEYWKSRKRHRTLDVLACATPVVLFAALALTYAVSPGFYLTYILEHEQREYQAVELATFAFGLTGAAALGWSTLSLWHSTTRARVMGLVAPRPGFAGAGDGRGGALIVAVVFAATFFLSMEEINWGQAFLRWGKPAVEDSIATNLHNNISMVQTLGALFMIAVFWGLPLLWSQRQRLRVPSDWAPAIAEWPLVVALAVAFLPSVFKDVYRATVADHFTQPIYQGYIEELKEQKEMLIALALLIYGFYRVSAARTLARVVAAAAAGGASAGNQQEKP